MVDKELVKCDACGNEIKNFTDPFERGTCVVYQGSHYRKFWWHREEQCIKRGKKLSKEYLKFLKETDTDFFCPPDGRDKEKERIELAKEKYRKLYGWEEAESGIYNYYDEE